MSEFEPDIWQLQAQFDIKGLINALQSEDGGTRRRAAAALRALGAVNSIPDLEIAIENEKDPESRGTILTALEALQAEKERRKRGILDTGDQPHILTEVERLINELKTGAPQEIMLHAAVLGKIGDKAAVPALMEKFSDPTLSIKVRLVIAEALLKLESAPVEVALLGALRSDDWHARHNSAAILGQLNAQWAIEPLGRALFDENEHVRKTAFAALRHIGTPEANAVLEAARQKVIDQKRKRNTPGKLTALPPQKTAADLNDETMGEKFKNDETQKITWPTKKRKPVNPTLAPTKPLDPRTVDQAINRVRRPVNRDSKDES